MNELWVEEFRPKSLESYVFRDPAQKKTIEGWVQDKSIPHVLLTGGPGVGKSTLAHVLLAELDVQPGDSMWINASRDNGVEMIRRKITQFSETMPWGDFKIVILDECDHVSPEGQAALRGVMEQYSSMVRFILTANYPNMVIPAIHSRCQSFHITGMDRGDFAVRVGEILVNKGVEFDLDTLETYVEATFPDLRKTINTVQLNVQNKKLIKPQDTESATDWKFKMVEQFKAGKLTEARATIAQSAGADDYVEIFRFLYRNLNLFAKNEDETDNAILIIRNGMVKHTQIADPEINMSATLVELANIGK